MKFSFLFRKFYFRDFKKFYFRNQKILGKLKIRKKIVRKTILGTKIFIRNLFFFRKNGRESSQFT